MNNGRGYDTKRDLRNIYNFDSSGNSSLDTNRKSNTFKNRMYYDEDTTSEYDSDIYKIGSDMLSDSPLNSNLHLDYDDENRIHKEYVMDYEIMSKEVNQYNSIESK